MRGINKAGLMGGAGLLGAGLMAGMRDLRNARPPAPMPPVSQRPIPPSAREKIIAIFPSLKLGETAAISGEAARGSTRGIVYSVDVYYSRDRGEDRRELTRLSSLTWPTEVEDWREVEKVEVLLNSGGMVPFMLEDGIVIG